MKEAIRYLIELRKRLLRVILVLGIILIAATFFANRIYTWLAIPIMQHLPVGPSLIATSVPAPFLVPFKSALMASVFLTIPYILYELWLFIAPALYKHERKLLWVMLFASTILFYVGVAFAYFLVLPVVFKFFIYIAPQGVEVKPDISLYLSFVIKMFFSFGFAFELPIAIMLLVFTGITTVEKLKQKRPYFIVGAFIAGMLLTPPDVVSQIMLAIPLWLLFELGLWMAKYISILAALRT